MLQEIEFGLPIMLPMLFLVGALVFTKGRKSGSRIVWTGVATALSLPIGILAVFLPTLVLTYDPTHEHSPGEGVAAIPLIAGWVLSPAFWFFGGAFVLARRLIDSK